MLDLVPFVQFKKRENTRGGVLILVKPATLLKLTLLHGCFSRFLNCTNSTKSSNISHWCLIGSRAQFLISFFRYFTA